MGLGKLLKQLTSPIREVTGFVDVLMDPLNEMTHEIMEPINDINRISRNLLEPVTEFTRTIAEPIKAINEIKGTIDQVKRITKDPFREIKREIKQPIREYKSNEIQQINKTWTSHQNLNTRNPRPIISNEKKLQVQMHNNNPDSVERAREFFKSAKDSYQSHLNRSCQFYNRFNRQNH